MLFNRRKRLRERAEAEARGESFWTTSFDNKVRTKLMYAAQEAVKGNVAELLERARFLILKDEGRPYLHSYGPNVVPAEDFYDYFMKSPDDDVPTAIEALHAAIQTFGVDGISYWIATYNAEDFGREVHRILEEERIAFDFIRGEMRPFESKELHQQVIEPVMTLLHDPKFHKAERAYQHALEEVTGGKSGDAITDASTALQETLTALGCTGNSLGPLIKSAREKGLLAAHDARMTKGIEDVMVWVSADRSEKGDSHKADMASKEDAWFVIHVIGALIVRLAGASGR